MTDEKDKDAALASWPSPVYSDTPPRDLSQFAICKHCDAIRMNHVNDECLFDSTTFEEKKSPVAVAPRHCTCRNGCKSATCDKL